MLAVVSCSTNTALPIQTTAIGLRPTSQERTSSGQSGGSLQRVTRHFNHLKLLALSPAQLLAAVAAAVAAVVAVATAVASVGLVAVLLVVLLASSIMMLVLVCHLVEALLLALRSLSLLCSLK
jgi:hypothetical protein